MQPTNMTEMFRERHVTLLREAEDRRLARQSRMARSKGTPSSGRRIVGFRRAIALWGRTSIPFFGS